MRATNICLNSGCSSVFAANQDANNALDVVEKSFEKYHEKIIDSRL
jgi:hypothetical protein